MVKSPKTGAYVFDEKGEIYELHTNLNLKMVAIILSSSE